MRMMKEIWKPIKYYEEDYEISNLGRVRSMTRRNGHGSFKRDFPHILTPHRKKRGKNPSKLEVRLWRMQKAVHRYIDCLVLETFIGECPKHFNQAVHKDSDQLNCKLKNLFWDHQSRHQKQPWSLCSTTGNPMKKLYPSSGKTSRERGLQTLRNLE